MHLPAIAACDVSGRVGARCVVIGNRRNRWKISPPARMASDVTQLIEQNNHIENFLWTDGKLGAYLH
jgi:hypothetical protein